MLRKFHVAVIDNMLDTCTQMPHLTIEYSANLADLVDMQAVIAALHRAALGTGIASLEGLRTRAAPRAQYLIADGDPSNVFVSVIARLAVGRSVADKQRFIDALLQALEQALGTAATHAMISVEYQEIDPDSRVNKNNLRPAVAAREEARRLESGGSNVR